MQLSDQVVSLELAKRLKELGVKQDSLFYYCNIDGQGVYYIYYNEAFPEDFEYEGDPVSAFSVSELGEMLPNCILKPELALFDNYLLTIKNLISVGEEINYTDSFMIKFECDSTETQGADGWLTRKLSMNVYDPNLSNAMAKMLILLLENGLIKND